MREKYSLVGWDHRKRQQTLRSSNINAEFVHKAQFRSFVERERRRAVSERRSEGAKHVWQVSAFTS
jgi:hypothetical protein